MLKKLIILSIVFLTTAHAMQDDQFTLSNFSGEVLTIKMDTTRFKLDTHCMVTLKKTSSPLTIQKRRDDNDQWDTVAQLPLSSKLESIVIRPNEKPCQLAEPFQIIVCNNK